MQEDGELKDINEVIAATVATIEGNLSPEQIQTISSLSSALNNDSNFSVIINFKYTVKLL